MPSNPKGPIALKVSICFLSFGRLNSQLSTTTREDYLLLQTALSETNGRFRVWSGNIGAHQSGKSSLDYRLRDASYISTRILRLLTDLDGLLRDAIAILAGTRQPLEESYSDYDSSGSNSDDEQPIEATEMRQIFQDISEVIKCLYRLSMSIRKTSNRQRYIKSATVDTSFYEAHDVNHVKEKFPLAEQYLVARLGKAISKRRQYLKYQETHAAKLAHDPQQGETTLSETTASVLKEVEGKQPDFEDTRSASGDSVMTETSYATSAENSIKARVPSMPKTAYDDQPFECPFCHRLESVKDTHAWIKHVYNDLLPYTCTFESCMFPAEMYDSRHQWFNHELKEHRRSWTCNGHCSQRFTSAAGFVAHIRSSSHVTEAQIPALVNMCAGPIDTTARSQCSLCKETIETSNKLCKHLGKHLEELALFALPNDYDEMGDEADSIQSVGTVENEEAVAGTTVEDSREDAAAGLPSEQAAIDEDNLRRAIEATSELAMQRGVAAAILAIQTFGEGEAREQAIKQAIDQEKVRVLSDLKSLGEGKIVEDGTSKAIRDLEFAMEIESTIQQPRAGSRPSATGDLQSDEYAFTDTTKRITTEDIERAETRFAMADFYEGETRQLETARAAEGSGPDAAVDLASGEDAPFDDSRRLAIQKRSDGEAWRSAISNAERAIKCAIADIGEGRARDSAIQLIIQTNLVSLHTLMNKDGERKVRESAFAEAEAEFKAEMEIFARTAAKRLEAEQIENSSEQKSTSALPIKLKDPLGRNFSIPWDICKTWKGMEGFIRQAFLDVEHIGPDVRMGRFDLIGPNKKIIPPKRWEILVEPGLTVRMHMWEMPMKIGDERPELVVLGQMLTSRPSSPSHPVDRKLRTAYVEDYDSDDVAFPGTGQKRPRRPAAPMFNEEIHASGDPDGYVVPILELERNALIREREKALKHEREREKMSIGKKQQSKELEDAHVQPTPEEDYNYDRRTLEVEDKGRDGQSRSNRRYSISPHSRHGYSSDGREGYIGRDRREVQKGGRDHYQHADNPLAPDILNLKYKNKIYSLLFPAFAIGEGFLRVGEIRKKAAQETGLNDPQPINLFYKGRLLEDDTAACREEGLKQNSELLMLVAKPVYSDED